MVSKSTYQKVSSYFDLESLGKFEVKGKQILCEAYKLKKQRDLGHVAFNRQIYSQMVGRDSELGKLERQVFKAINGEGSIVNVIGEAGIGKSRLIAELKNIQIMKKVALREGRAISMGKGLSFHPIIDIFKNLARIKNEDTDAVVIQKLASSIRKISPQDVDDILPFILTLMGVKLTAQYAERVKGIEGDALEKLILKSVKDLLIRSSDLIPLVIIFEDLHWADSSTLALLESIFRLAQSRRILFINVFRPRFTETDVKIVQIVKSKFPNHYVEIELHPLSDQFSETLIDNMLKKSRLPYTIKNRIVKRAGGNPFFLEEVVRSFIDHGAIVRNNGGFKVTENIDLVAIPPTINDLLIARIDRLEEKTRELVKVASVIGRSFFYRVLSEIERPLEDIDKRLGYLKAIELIRDRIRMEELEYLFKHALIHETAYESLLFQKRKELHIIVAQAIEKVFNNKLHEFFAMLAYHYSKGENLDKAEQYMIKAGEEALRSSASSEALTYYQEALKLYQNKYGDTCDPDKLAMLEENIALAFFNKGQYANALDYFDRVLEHMGEKPSRRGLAAAARLIFDLISLIVTINLPAKNKTRLPDEKTNQFFNLHYKRSILLVYLDNKRLFIEYLRALRILKQFDAAKIENGALIWLSTSGLFSWSGISFKMSKKMLIYAKSIVNTNSIKDLLYYDLFEIMYNFFSGNWQEIKKYSENLIDLNLKVGELWHSSTYVTLHGLVEIDQGCFTQAKSLAGKLSEICEDYDYETARGAKFFVSTKLLLKLRKLDEAISEANEAISFQRKIDEELRIIYFLGLKAIAQILLNDSDGAMESLSEAKAIKLRKGRVVPYFVNSYIMARFVFSLHVLENSKLSNDKSHLSKYKKAALHRGKIALKTCEKYAADQTEASRLMGIYYWIVDNQNMAIKWWKRSVQEGKTLGATTELSRTYMEIGKRLLEQKSKYRELNSIKPEEYLDMAREMFEGMDLQWDLNELKRIVGSAENNPIE